MTIKPLPDDELIHQLRRAVYIHFGKSDVQAFEELLRRYEQAKKAKASELPE